ncbi:hypothetical protein [Helicobacter fennelliae]|uniref:Uncharacterized protein n=1 Tax=Helicobacter fennelliae MRY12-0050 TaxID=1325130 RepID=T1DUJ0_9HELI|nr:hypothetical protein [Helicobacter fennelliae]GAD17853.1 hypothetical protein HFN_0668 [Helicobacter fennelliae MRY12-0050]
MMNMKHFILNELPISSDIQNKIDFIKTSKLSYDDFSNFRFLMNNLDNFSVNYKLSEESIKRNINNFVHKLIKDLDFIVDKVQNTQEQGQNEAINTLENQISFFDYSKSSNTLFYEALARISEFNENKETDNIQMGNLIQEVQELLWNKEEDFNKEQKEILDEIVSTLKEEFVLYLGDSKNIQNIVAIPRDEIKELEKLGMLEKVENENLNVGQEFSEDIKKILNKPHFFLKNIAMKQST